MYPHHQHALERAIERLQDQGEAPLAIIIGGSIAKGTERADSDVDLIVVVSEQEYWRRLQDDSVVFFWEDIADYPGGYVEGRYIDLNYLEQAAQRGSEPTRHAFTGARVLLSQQADLAPRISQLLAQIPLYPEAQRNSKIKAFYSQYWSYNHYFWQVACADNDPYLKLRSASNIVLFGCRMLLAHNRLLFPCQRRLLQQLERATDKPEGIVNLAKALMSEPTEANRQAFCDAIEQFRDWQPGDVPQILSRQTRYAEMHWFTGDMDLAEC